MAVKDRLTLEIPDDFTTQNESANLPARPAQHNRSKLKLITNELVRTINKQKLDYNQLKYLFRVVRDKCDIKSPRNHHKLYKLPTEGDRTKFYQSISNPIHSLIFEFLEGTGLRVSELCALKVSSLDLDKNLVFIHQGKGGKDRVTVMGDHLMEKVKIYLAGKNNIYLFESNRNTKYSTRRIQQLCQKYWKLSLIKNEITCHTFRHLWNTFLAAANIPREKREILAGHARGSKTQDIYTHLAVGGIKDEVILVLNQAATPNSLKKSGS